MATNQYSPTSGGGNGQTSNTASFLNSMARVMPPMLQVMKDIGGIEMPEYFVKLNEPAPVPSAKPAPSSNGHVPDPVSERM